MNKRELFFIYCAFQPCQVNVATFMLAHLRMVSRASSGTIVVGDLITSIVIALDLEVELNPFPTVLSSFILDIIACHSQYIIRAKSSDIYTLMIAHHEITSIVLSDPRHIDMHDNLN